jgi:transcriptional regulator with XRE-family HTH domain
MRKISERLRELSLLCGGNKKLCEKFGINERTFAHWLAGQSEPKASTLEEFVRGLDLNPVWMLLGEGSIRVSESLPVKGEKPLDEQRLIIIIGKVEALLREQKLKLEPDKKGELIALLYQLFEDEKEVDDQKVVRFLKLAS